MADVNKLAPLIFKWEGGWANDKADKGGKTNMGVTLSTWKAVGYDKDNDSDIDANDLKVITKNDVINVLRKYWNKWKGDYINNQSVANLIVDWVWGSGKWGIIIPQRILNVKADGVVGPITIKALNNQPPRELFNRIYKEREKFLYNIVKKDPIQKKFLKGWLNRLADFKYSD